MYTHASEPGKRYNESVDMLYLLPLSEMTLLRFGRFSLTDLKRLEWEKPPAVVSLDFGLTWS